MERLLIIDGHNLLFQMFYGMYSKITGANGKPIQGTLGFVGALIKIIKMTEPTHMVVLFDSEHGNKRTLLLPEYKANRIDYSQMPDEETPFSQLEDIYRALDYMKIRHTEIEGAEVDDIVSAYVHAYRNDMVIIISSFDSDYFQLIDEHVSVLRYRGKHTLLCDRTYINDKFGIEPYQYADWKCLTGDNADNIKGVSMVGPKTASRLLQQFGSLEQLLIRTDEIPRSCIRASIAASAKQLLLNQKLIQLTGQAGIPFSLEQLTYRYNGIHTREVLHGIYLQ